MPSHSHSYGSSLLPVKFRGVQETSVFRSEQPKPLEDDDDDDDDDDKIKFNLEQDMEAQRGSRGVAVLFL